MNGNWNDKIFTHSKDFTYVKMLRRTGAECCSSSHAGDVTDAGDVIGADDSRFHGRVL